MCECALGGSLAITVVLAQIFWRNPIRHSTVHRLDAAAAKLSLACFVMYTLSRNLTTELMLSYSEVLAGAAVAAALSQYYSCREWCGYRHVYAHAMLHTLCAIGAFYAFLNADGRYTSHTSLIEERLASFSPAYPTGLQ